jgi:hypothetical protein
MHLQLIPDDLLPDVKRVRFGAPPGHESSVGILQALVVPDEEFGVILYSRWQPTPDELAELNAGGNVWLGICGAGHPAVHLVTDGAWKPPTDIVDREVS